MLIDYKANDIATYKVNYLFPLLRKVNQQTVTAAQDPSFFNCQHLFPPAAMLPKIHYTKINITFVEKFGPVFATEGDSATLSATMTLNPNLANLQPEAQWYRDGKGSKAVFYDKMSLLY